MEATVSVRKDGDSTERFSLKIPISMKGLVDDNVDVKPKVIAEITDSAFYRGNNSYLRGPDALHAVNTFTVKETSLAFVKYSIKMPDNGHYQASVVAKIDGVTFTPWLRNSVNEQNSALITFLTPGTHTIELCMDADNEGGSIVTYQNYKTLSVLTIKQ